MLGSGGTVAKYWDSVMPYNLVCERPTTLNLHSLAGNTGETDHPKPEQIDHLKGWRKLPNFAGEDFQFSADLV